MRFQPTNLDGVRLIHLERHEDERGFFARTFCRDEFSLQGLPVDFVQRSTSYNRTRGTLRGMHYQSDPHAEAKLVRCTRGALYDVVLDVRPGSPTFRRWISVELTQDNGQMLFIPEGYAHGFQTLVDDTEMYYEITVRYHPDAARGVRWNDPSCGIIWPLDNPVMSPRDAGFPLLSG